MFGLGYIASHQFMMFAFFTVLVGFMLYIDLYLVNRKARFEHTMTASTLRALSG